jgi:hypothetical protein
VFTARYALSPYIKQIRFVFKGLIYVIYTKCRCHGPRRLRRESAAARLLGLWVRIPPGSWMSVCCEYCVFSGRGFCVGLITRPVEFYRVRCVSGCDREASIMRTPWSTGGFCAMEKKIQNYSMTHRSILCVRETEFLLGRVRTVR